MWRHPTKRKLRPPKDSCAPVPYNTTLIARVDIYKVTIHCADVRVLEVRRDSSQNFSPCVDIVRIQEADDFPIRCADPAIDRLIRATVHCDNQLHSCVCVLLRLFYGAIGRSPIYDNMFNLGVGLA